MFCLVFSRHFTRIKGNPGDCVSVQLLRQAEVHVHGCLCGTERIFDCRCFL